MNIILSSALRPTTLRNSDHSVPEEYLKLKQNGEYTSTLCLVL